MLVIQILTLCMNDLVLYTYGQDSAPENIEIKLPRASREWVETWGAVGGPLRCRRSHYFSHCAMLCCASWDRPWHIFGVVVHRTKNVESVEEQERVLPRVSIKSWISDLGPQLSDLIRPIRGANHEASINEVVTLTS